MGLKDKTVAVIAIIVGVILLFIGAWAWNNLAQPTAFNLGLGIIAIGIMVLICGIVIAFTSGSRKEPKATGPVAASKKVEVAASPEEFIPEVLLPRPGKKLLPVSTVEGIGKKYQDELEKGHIKWVEELALAKSETVSELTGVNSMTAKKWIAMARLTWLDDVSNEDAECIVLGANITSIEELAVADAEDLYNEVSTAEKFGRVQVPKGYKITKDKVKLWIESAKKEMPE